VQPFLVVITLDELFQMIAQIIQIRVLIRVNLFAFQRLDEALATRIVVRVSRPTHARLNRVLFQDRNVFSRSILDAAIRMMDHPGQWLARINRHCQRIDCQTTRQRAVQLPAHHLREKPSKITAR